MRVRIAHDRRLLEEFVGKNSNHLRVERSGAKSIDIGIRGVKALTELDEAGRPRFGDQHRVQIYCPEDYPYGKPSLIPLTPIFHPNVRLRAEVPDACWGDYRPDFRDTFSFMIRQYIEMIQYRAYNLSRPHRLQNEAGAIWLEKRLKDSAVELPLRPMVRMR